MNKNKLFRTITIILLVSATLFFIVGMERSVEKAKEASHDVSKIKVRITDKEVSGSSIELTYEIVNRTGSSWSYLETSTSVCDKSGKSLGTVTAQFGSLGGSDLKLKPGEKLKKTVVLKSSSSALTEGLINFELKDLKLTSEVTYGNYYK